MIRFNIQPESSSVNWTGKKVLGLHTGTIFLQSGFLDFDQDQLIGGELTMDMTRITVTDMKEQKLHYEFLHHLQSADFFAVDQYKTAKLTITKCVKTGDRHTVYGDLAIKGITNPISFNTSIEILTDFLHAMGELKVDRTVYGIKYGSGKFSSNLGNKLIYDEFVIQFKLIGQK